MPWDWGSAGKGAAGGAAIGSFFPGFGTLIGGGLGGLFGGLFGGGTEPVPPDPSAWMYQGLGQYPTEMVEQGEKAIRQQTTNWLENALRGIRGEMSGRGWTPSTSGQYGELGERASGIASQNMSTALAQLYAQAAGIQHQGSLAGANLFQQAYMNYLYPPNQTGGGGDDWINSVLAILPTLL